MGYAERTALYHDLEQKRGRHLIAYVTSIRPNAVGQIASDAVPELLYQLQALPPPSDAVDFLVVSIGGDPLVAWQMVSVIRERVSKFSVLVPYMAFSSATLIALGADEIVMHPHAHLGPTDPQIQTSRGRKNGDGPARTSFGTEDLAAFLRFAKDEVGLTDQSHMLEVFKQFCQDVGAVPLGVAARSAQLTPLLGEKLLQLHMKTEGERRKAKSIVQKLTREFFHHGYRVSRTEAKEAGLKVARSDPAVESLVWSIWQSISDEMSVRQPFFPLALLPEEALLQIFKPVPLAQIPSNLPPEVMQRALQSILSQIGINYIAPASYELIGAVMESARYASRFVTHGRILATRLPNMQIQAAAVPTHIGWETLDQPSRENTPHEAAG